MLTGVSSSSLLLSQLTWHSWEVTRFVFPRFLSLSPLLTSLLWPLFLFFSCHLCFFFFLILPRLVFTPPLPFLLCFLYSSSFVALVFLSFLPCFVFCPLPVFRCFPLLVPSPCMFSPLPLSPCPPILFLSLPSPLSSPSFVFVPIRFLVQFQLAFAIVFIPSFWFYILMFLSLSSLRCYCCYSLFFYSSSSFMSVDDFFFTSSFSFPLY